MCAAAAASRQSKSTALHLAALNGHAPCVEALLKAGADARLKDKVRDGAEGRGGRRKGARGRGAGGVGLGGKGPCAGAAPPLRAARSPPPAPSAAAASTSAPSPRFPRRQDGATALDNAKSKGHTQVIALLENAAAVAAQVGPSITCRQSK